MGRRSYSARLAPLRDAYGNVIGGAGVQQIIGWMPDDDAPFRESDVRLRRAIDANIAGIIFGNEDGQITDANEAFLEIIGYTREDMTTDGISWPRSCPWNSTSGSSTQSKRCEPPAAARPSSSICSPRRSPRPVLVAAARLSARRREGVAFVLDVSDARHGAICR